MNTLRAAAAITALGCALAAAAPAQAPAPEAGAQLRLNLECLDEECSVVAVPLQLMRAIKKNTELFAEENRELKRQLEEMRKLKGCAKSEVTQPSKNPAPTRFLEGT